MVRPARAARSALDRGRASLTRARRWVYRSPAHQRLVAGGVITAVALVAATGLVVSASSTYGAPDGPPATGRGHSGISGNAALPMLGRLHRAAHLPAATTSPAAAPASLAAAPPMAAREVFGFAPYWTLEQNTGFDLSGLTTVAYFSVGIDPDGTLDQSGPGWNGYQSQALVDLVDRAHAAGVRVVLTVNDFDQQ
ncbi:MAG TPA: hypothetical protein VHW47_10055, partial [Acidimicrobiales bacterium]|nr:hypothetical protein [Acidimicrobiales bacterium]